jgi:putative acyl-CoA dehydrogenase
LVHAAAKFGRKESQVTYVNPEANLRTHTVENQPLPFAPKNVFLADVALVEALSREGGGWAHQRMVQLGAVAGDPENTKKAILANRFAPELKRFDSYGRRVDTVEFHPAWHDMMSLAWEHELHALPWNHPRPGAQVAKAAASILFNQLEGGVMCPYAISYGILPMLRLQPELAAIWEPLIRSVEYDPRPLPHFEKKGVTLAFSVTEKQAGSDVRRAATEAKPVAAAGPGREYILRGHKWFCSAAGADAIFIAAQTEKGLGCFLVPRWLNDGSRNPISIERLKDKLGNKSNASAELEMENTRGWLIGEEGRGIQTMMLFMLYTRFECALAAVGIMRAGLARAVHHVQNRSAFQRRLIDQPLMRNVLADLSLDYEAATALVLRIARAFDSSEEGERSFGRIAVALAKYWLNKQSVPFVHEAMEMHGGIGYIEDTDVARFYREAPLHGIWEGAGNVISLDVLRALRKDQGAMSNYLDELKLAAGGNRELDQAVSEIGRLLHAPLPEDQARHVAERMAVVLQAALLVRHAPSAVADGFCASRLHGRAGQAYGTLSSKINLDGIISRVASTG